MIEVDAAGAVGLAFAAGGAIGAAYFALLWRSSRAAMARGDIRTVLAGTVVRLTGIVAALAAATALGASAVDILAALGGFVLARLAATRWLGRRR